MQHLTMPNDKDPAKGSPSGDKDPAKDAVKGSPGGSGNDRQELSALRYDAVVRSLDNQQGALTEVRSRTGLLISAASISTAFLGSVAAKGRPGFPPVFLFAVIPFGVSIVLALIILMPWPGWSFALRGDTFRAFQTTPGTRIKDTLAVTIEKQVDSNEFRMNVMSWFFGISSLALLWSIVAWIVVIE